MPVVKALVGGVIGGCLGAYIVNLIGPVRGAAGPWLILLAGLGAGLGTRLICGANRSFMTGVAAAIAAILGVTIISYSTAAVALQSSDEMEAPLPVAKNLEASSDEASDEEETIEDDTGGDESGSDGEQDGDEAETSESGDESASGADTDGGQPASDDEEAQQDREQLEPPTKAPYELPADTLAENAANSKNTHSDTTMDLIANAVSALLAFLLGAGASAPAGVAQPAANEEQSAGDDGQAT